MNLFPKSRTLSFADIDSLCEGLASDIASLPSIDCIVSIERGGWYIGKKLAEYVQKKEHSICIARYDADELDTMYASKSFFHRLRFVGLCLTYGRKEPQLISGISNISLIKDKCVLLVDDVVRTGNSMLLGREHLLSLGATDVRTATITNYQNIEVDIKCLNGRTLCYPWSRLSEEYSQFMTLYHSHH